MNAWFADTYYYLALLNPDDRQHKRAAQLSREGAHPIVTSVWILMEVGDAFAAPHLRTAYVNFVRLLGRSRRVKVLSPSRELFDRALHLYENRPDKNWGITDCTSFTIMREMGIREALTGDHHFEQAGFVCLPKS